MIRICAITKKNEVLYDVVARRNEKRKHRMVLA